MMWLPSRPRSVSGCAERRQGQQDFIFNRLPAAQAVYTKSNFLYGVEARMSASTPNRISVALCTYNGERFLPQQLASIAKQTRPPDELVVCDDRSTDRTVGLVRDFAASSPYPVRIFENDHNLGFAANFERAIR